MNTFLPNSKDVRSTERNDNKIVHGVYHLTFWIFFYFFLVIIAQSQYPLGQNLIFNFAKVLLYSLGVYANLLWLVPTYLTKRKFITYFILFEILVSVIALAEFFLRHWAFNKGLSIEEAMAFQFSPIFILTFFVLASSSIYKIMTDWIDFQRVKKELKSETIRTELKFLKNQINPHFLFNSLNNLYALTLSKSDKAPQMVLKLSEMMRYMLYESNEKFVPLEKEIKYLSNYIELEKMRLGREDQIELDIVGDYSDKMIAPMVLQPFIENAFKHGLNKDINGFAKIRIGIDDDNLKLLVENNIAETAKSNVDKKTRSGVGLQNTQRRLRLLYPERHTLTIERSDQQFYVDLTLKLSNQTEPILI